MKTGIELIAEERERQISQEGWTPEHDDQHAIGEIADAACAYSRAASLQATGLNTDFAADVAKELWPWDEDWLKVSPDIKRNLAKAGALIAAELDRLQRLEL